MHCWATVTHKLRTRALDNANGGCQTARVAIPALHASTADGEWNADAAKRAALQWRIAFLLNALLNSAR
eukprot:5599700-Lingulodinium_polyedra.AAC.1